MLPAVITVTFDATVAVGGLIVRIETLALAVALLMAVLLMARVAVAARSASDPSAPAARLRLDDLLFILLGVVPGALVGGRLDDVLGHVEAYRLTYGSIIDPSFGGLGLGLAVLGGILTATPVARLLGAPIRAWWHAAALPLLFALGAGKVAMALGGSGQGVPSDASWATAYVGPGPWGSLAPALPSIPSQLIEATGSAYSCSCSRPRSSSGCSVDATARSCSSRLAAGRSCVARPRAHGATPPLPERSTLSRS